jgi:hypothetical protein
VTPHSRFVAKKRDSHYETILPIYPYIILKKPINPYMNFTIPVIVENDAYKLKFASKLSLLQLHNKYSLRPVKNAILAFEKIPQRVQS